jgi:signal transduction histidine kinase
MQQVFLNLINNALDAVNEKGEVRLAVEAERGGVRVRVIDNGPGIPEKERARVFEPFYSTKDGSREHTGLGLAICQEIMTNLGGSIGVEEGPEGGAAFSLWFPPEAKGT